MEAIRRIGGQVLRKVGLKAERLPEIDDEARRIIARAQPYTMVFPERTYALIEAVRYITAAGIPGAIVECGVYRGGSMMAAAMTLTALKQTRDIYLYDTYAGMPQPTTHDVDYKGTKASDVFESDWCCASLDEVKANLARTAYPSNRLHFVPGKVEDTIPGTAPEQIALLRLDTDWYTSTKHEITHLFPRLEKGGVLLLDDYGKWEGSRKAVTEYFQEKGVHMLLARVDTTGRIGIKT